MFGSIKRGWLLHKIQGTFKVVLLNDGNNNRGFIIRCLLYYTQKPRYHESGETEFPVIRAEKVSFVK